MISVIIPVFNGEKTIRQAILSAIYDQGDIVSEIIVVDDGSTDRTPGILRELQTEIPINIISQENRGPGAARNTALEQTHGDFVLFLDADDYLTPMALEHMQACMRAYNAAACVAETRQLLGNLPIGHSIECWHQPHQPIIDIWDSNFLVEITPAVRAKMFRREILTGLVFSETKWEDLAFIPAALAAAGRIAILNEPVYNYRFHLNTTLKDFLFKCEVADILTSAEVLERNLQNAKISDSRVQQHYRSILTLHTVFRIQNVMTWPNVKPAEKRQVITSLVQKLTARYPDWQNDMVLNRSKSGYRDPFFQLTLRKLHKDYLR